MKIDIKRIREEIATLPSTKQILLQTDGITTEAGSYPENEQDFIIPMYDIPHLNELMKYYGMARTRVMNMKKGCYSWHYDLTPRVHIPVKVTEGSCMIVGDEVIRFTEGEARIVDTTMMHTAVNPSEEIRTHVVGVLCDWHAPGIREILVGELPDYDRYVGG